jgi:hypothetical protein
MSLPPNESETRMTEHTPEHVILVAVSVTAPTREIAEAHLHIALPRPTYIPEGTAAFVDSWWVAEDDRRDGSDNDSAVFVNPGRQAQAYALLESVGLANQGGLGFPDDDEVVEAKAVDTSSLWAALHACDEAKDDPDGSDERIIETLIDALGEALSLLTDLGVSE